MTRNETGHGEQDGVSRHTVCMSDAEDEFAALFEASTTARRIERGQTIEGTIVAIGPEVAFVDVGGKGEATVDVAELKDADGDLEVAVGDRLQAVVVSTAGELRLSRRLARGAATDRQLEEAFATGLPVEGRVEGTNKGGYEVRIGRQRAFCPFSQIDTVATDPSAHEGRVYQFRITAYAEGGRRFVVSRRLLLEEQQKASAAEVRRSIVAGATVTGRVVSVREFGAFVDLGGGVQGLLHVSEMGWSRVTDPTQMVKPGDEITVKVLRLDEEGQKIALGLKQLSADPWSGAHETYQIGRVYPGRVTRIADFGAFVELEPGVEALAHASTFAPTGRAKGWTSEVAPGMTGQFEILTVDPGKKRIGVALVTEDAARGATPSSSRPSLAPGAHATGTVERHAPFGVFVFLAPGCTGLIPTSETGVARDADVTQAFPVGADVDVVVLDVDPAGRRIRLSAKAVQDAKEAEEMRDYAARQDSSAPSFGSLADKLRGALGTRQRQP